MRHRLALILPFLMLAACGGGGGGEDNGQPGTESWARNQIGNQGSPNFRRPDGSFDRADYRRIMIPGCAAGMRDGGPDIPAEAIDRYCTCFVDRVLAANSDDELRAMLPGGAQEQREYEEASASCRPALSGAADAATAAVAPQEPATNAPSAARPSLPLASYLSADDYPAAALRNNEQGTTAFILDISPEGRVTNCRITQSSGSAALDSATCRIMRSRARFHPARNAQGDAVPGTSSARISWRLPED